MNDDMMRTFTQDLAAQLRRSGVPHDLAAVQAFVADCWPWIKDDQVVGRWAREFEAAREPRAPDPPRRSEIASLMCEPAFRISPAADYPVRFQCGCQVVFLGSCFHRSSRMDCCAAHSIGDGFEERNQLHAQAKQQLEMARRRSGSRAFPAPDSPTPPNAAGPLA